MKIIPTSTEELYYSRHTRREPLTFGEFAVIVSVAMAVLAVLHGSFF